MSLFIKSYISLEIIVYTMSIRELLRQLISCIPLKDYYSLNVFLTNVNIHIQKWNRLFFILSGLLVTYNSSCSFLGFSFFTIAWKSFICQSISWLEWTRTPLIRIIRTVIVNVNNVAVSFGILLDRSWPVWALWITLRRRWGIAIPVLTFIF